jgi:hypothetical protein
MSVHRREADTAALNPMPDCSAMKLFGPGRIRDVERELIPRQSAPVPHVMNWFDDPGS